MTELKNRLAMLRENKGWTKTRVAKQLGVGLSTYANWEYGYSEPDSEMINRIASLYSTSTDYILGNDLQESANSFPTSTDLDKMLDNARSFDGKPMSDNDRELIKSYLKVLFDKR